MATSVAGIIPRPDRGSVPQMQRTLLAFAVAGCAGRAEVAGPSPQDAEAVAGPLVDAVSNSSPVLAPDGTVLMLTPASFQAFTPAGAPRWTQPVTAGQYSAQPTVDAGGNSFFLADSGKTIVALTPAGSPLWTSPVQNAVGGAVVIGSDGMLLINGGLQEQLYVFAP